MNWALADRIEQSQPGDLYFDYCLWPYEPPLQPGQSALRSSALLYHSFQVAGVSDKMLEVTDAIRDRFGKFKTVWGVKYAGDALSWEFYFYDYERVERALGIADFVSATKGLLACDFPVDDEKPYFMFSVEFDDSHANGRPLDQVDIYIGNPGSEVSSGVCYGLSQTGVELRNFYFFFDANRQRDEIMGKVGASMYLPFRKTDFRTILWPEMEGAEVIVAANKRFNDGLYFSRISAGQLTHFLERLRFPKEITDFSRANEANFSHHLFDVGYDYLPDGKGGVKALKGSYYGLL